MKRIDVATIAVAIGGSMMMCAAAAEEAAAPAPAPVVQQVEVKGLARFDFNKAEVNPDDGAKLMAEVRAMKNVTWQKISVTGHTDGIGSEQFNQKLSEKRADAVRGYLIEKSVKPEKISTEGMGKRVPIASNATASGRALNRRVEIRFLGLQTLAQK